MIELLLLFLASVPFLSPDNSEQELANQANNEEQVQIIQEDKVNDVDGSGEKADKPDLSENENIPQPVDIEENKKPTENTPEISENLVVEKDDLNAVVQTDVLEKDPPTSPPEAPEKPSVSNNTELSPPVVNSNKGNTKPDPPKNITEGNLDEPEELVVEKDKPKTIMQTELPEKNPSIDSPDVPKEPSVSNNTEPPPKTPKLNNGNGDSAGAMTQVESDKENLTDMVKEEESPTIEKMEVVKSDEENNQSYLKDIVIAALLLLLLLSALMNSRLIKRQTKTKEQPIDSSQNLSQQIDDLKSKSEQVGETVKTELKNYAETVKQQGLSNKETSNTVTEKYDEILESFSIMQKYLSDREAEINRLKKGYDLQILKKFISRLLKISDACEIIINDPNVSEETKKEMEFISGYLGDLISDTGVKEYAFESGQSAKDKSLYGLPPADEWVTELTSEKDKEFKIIETVKSGYYIDSELKEVLKYPKIKVYIPEKYID